MRTERLWLVWCVMAGLLGTSGAAHALPTSLTRTEFQNLTSGLLTQFEDFNSFYAGPVGQPLELENGIVTFSTGSLLITSGTYCSSGFCLQGSVHSGTRTFDSFPSGTQFWGTDFAAFTPTNIFDVTVIGGSGTLFIDDVAASDFFGFQDEMGLTSVTFENVTPEPPYGNYTFDDVTTAVPEPSTSALLLVSGLAGLAATRRRAS